MSQVWVNQGGNGEANGARAPSHHVCPGSPGGWVPHVLFHRCKRVRSLRDDQEGGVWGRAWELCSREHSTSQKSQNLCQKLLSWKLFIRQRRVFWASFETVETNISSLNIMSNGVKKIPFSYKFSLSLGNESTHFRVFSSWMRLSRLLKVERNMVHLFVVKCTELILQEQLVSGYPFN